MGFLHDRGKNILKTVVFESTCCCVCADSETDETHLYNRSNVIPIEARAVRQSRWTTQVATAHMSHVRPVSEAVAHDKALQVLENRLRDWMTRNYPASSRDTWRKPFSASGAPPPPRITRLRRVVTDVRYFYVHFCCFLTPNIFLH